MSKQWWKALSRSVRASRTSFPHIGGLDLQVFDKLVETWIFAIVNMLIMWLSIVPSGFPLCDFLKVEVRDERSVIIIASDVVS